ncbi:filamentous hemagglutinin N-terminal domain-containing protein [Leptolyngbya sp. FACHB-261]|uniref:two-partner secretion domain-containing protein n=1 Tax=Leptolyngbya sp. FACHB-261 TaxID=2692806 RepID=UPI001687983C|nr:filamentous hemagglutinin N-terminal domain-containing protein [Leptolyngbya sp. FACHB-261]MBD2102469.1 filamentous hemagglutinin N-terminal domain-containing protein [Leptolyngbya sp. FACHB-261]
MLKTWLRQGGRWGLVSSLVLVCSLGERTEAQIVPDRTLGSEHSVVRSSPDLPVDAIEGGAIRGTNLFHSFQRFNVSEGRAVYFISPEPAIQNILARVTGRSRSEILGTLGTLGGSNPNLFLINPNGVVFGPQASLDIAGSLVATSANAVKLGSGSFSASAPATSQLLTINPSALIFNAPGKPASIVNHSRAATTALGGALNGPLDRPIRGLQVLDGRSLLLVGGDLKLEQSLLTAPGGRIELGSVGGPGTVELLGSRASVLATQVPDSLTRANVSISASVLDVTGAGGSVAINSHNLDIFNGSGICAGLGSNNVCRSTTSNSGSSLDEAGNIGLNATGNIRIRQFSRIENDVNPNATGNNSNIFDAIENDKLFGSVVINGRTVSITDGAQVSTSTSGRGNAGLVFIAGSDKVRLDQATLFSTVDEGAVGDAGGILITGGSISLDHGTELQAQTSGRGLAGLVALRSQGPVSLANRSIIGSTVETTAQGRSDSGGIIIAAESLTLTNNSQLQTQTDGQGKAGPIVALTTGPVSLSDSGMFSTVESEGRGKGGNIVITAGALNLTDGSLLRADTTGQGNAGNILVQSQGPVLADNSSFSTFALSFKGGDINIDASDIRLLEGSDIVTSVLTGDQNGGRITLTADTIVALGDSDILAFAQGGRGGDITLNTPAFFSSPFYRPSPPLLDLEALLNLDGNDQVDINASGSLSTGIITLPDISFLQNSFTELPANLLDTDRLLANSCIVRRQQQEGSFIVTGSGGLPVLPDDFSESSFETYNLPSQHDQPAHSRPWRSGDPVVEPQGAYRLANGVTVLSRDCP